MTQLFVLILLLTVSFGSIRAQDDSPGVDPNSSIGLLDIPAGTGQVVSCPRSFHTPKHQLNGFINYQFDHNKEKFYIYVPTGFLPSEAQTYGVVVFMNAGPGDSGMPNGWQAVLDKRKLFLIAPSNVGNSEPLSRRLGLGVISAEVVYQYFGINTHRIYSAGISGGARMAGMLGFYHPEIFIGTIQSCGADFYKTVPRVAVTDDDLKKHSEAYGLCDVSDTATPKRAVKFVLITGPGDFRHNFILDIYNGGFQQEGFNVLLLDVPGMGHQICSGETLEQALHYIEGE